MSQKKIGKSVLGDSAGISADPRFEEFKRQRQMELEENRRQEQLALEAEHERMAGNRVSAPMPQDAPPQPSDSFFGMEVSKKTIEE